MAGQELKDSEGSYYRHWRAHPRCQIRVCKSSVDVESDENFRGSRSRRSESPWNKFGITMLTLLEKRFVTRDAMLGAKSSRSSTRMFTVVGDIDL